MSTDQRAYIPDCLYTHRTHSKCRGVYPLANGWWEVKVKHQGRIVRLGKTKDVNRAIRLLVDWYRERFGPHWEYVAARREANPWKIVREENGNHSLYVWLFGERMKACEWATFEEAKANHAREIRNFIRRELRRLGLKPPPKDKKIPVLWRIVGEKPPPPPAGSVWWAVGRLASQPCGNFTESISFELRATVPVQPHKPRNAMKPICNNLPDMEKSLSQVTADINRTAVVLGATESPAHERALRLVADLRMLLEGWMGGRKNL